MYILPETLRHPPSLEDLVIGHDNLSADYNIGLARSLTVLEDVLLAISVAQTTTTPCVVRNGGCGDLVLLVIVELVVSGENSPLAAVGAFEPGCLLIALVVGALAIAKDAE